jgi:hypothetical protein
VKLNRRERILLIVVAALIGLGAAWFLLFAGGSVSYSELVARRDQLAGELEKKEATVKAAKTAAKRLADWQKRALPSELSDARLNYRIWLRQLVTRLQFQQATVEATGEQTRAKTFTVLKFRIHGRTNLPKLTEFLWEFYSAGHLHLISQFEVAAVPNSGDIDVNLDVEAMALPTADRTTELTKEPGKSLRLSTQAEYGKIAERNFFRAFQPPNTQPTVFVTAIVRTEERSEVWLVDRASKRDWKLHENENFDSGMVKGTIKTIGTRAVAIEIDGNVGQYHCGDSLASTAGHGPPGQPPGMGGGPPDGRRWGPPGNRERGEGRPDRPRGSRRPQQDGAEPTPAASEPKPDGPPAPPKPAEAKPAGEQSKPAGEQGKAAEEAEMKAS